MKVCFVSPYIPKHVGGGERYLLDCARFAADKHEVVLAVPETKNTSLSKTDLANIKQKYQEFLGNPLDGVDFVPSPLFTEAGFLKKLLWTRRFDALYYATDGSFFVSLASRNIMHIQIPFTDSKTWLDRLKLNTWHVTNTNSHFTKKVVEENWHIKIGTVHWPMTDLKNIHNFSKHLQQKQHIILHVGRFFRQLHTKRQDVLVDMFVGLKKQHPELLDSWKLVLIGSVEDESYAAEVARKAKGEDIEIHHSVSREELWKWYDKASLYWHATGFGVDETRHPEKVEHFGITTFEAMSRGCVPVVIGKGGQPEVLGPELQDLLWQTKSEGIEITQHLLQDVSKREVLAKKAYQRAQVFGPDRFKNQLLEMLEPK